MKDIQKDIQIDKFEINNLNSRENEILLNIVESHIENESPISSLYLNRSLNNNLSSASIRTIMSELEANGYLYSTHRSAGRLPTSKAFRHYVNHKVVPSRSHILNLDESYIQSEFLKQDLAFVENILVCAARILTFMTSYATLVLGPKIQSFVLKHLEIIDMGTTELLIIAVTRSGDVFSRKVYVEERISQTVLRNISSELSQKFNGLDLTELLSRINNELRNNILIEYSIILKVLEKYFSSLSSESHVCEDGVNLLSKYLDKESCDYIRKLILNKELKNWYAMMEKGSVIGSDLEILITDENESYLKGAAIISGGYKMGEKNIGSLCVIGPMRMNYHRITTLVVYMRQLLSNMITRITK